MVRIAAPDEVPKETDAALCRVLHPSYGLSSRLVLTLLREAGSGGTAAGSGADEHLAEVTRIDAVPRFLARRRPARP